MRTFYFAAVVSSFFFFFLLAFLAYSQRSRIGCLPYLHTWCGLRANLECRSEMYCTQPAESTGCKSYAKITVYAHHRTTLLGYIFATKVRNWKKIVKQKYLHTFSQYGELQPTNGWDQLASLGHPSKFQPVWHLGLVTARTLFNGGQSNFGRCLAVSWAGTLCRRM